MAAALLLAAMGSCDSDPVVEPEASLEIVPDSVTLTHIGQQFSFSVRGGGPGSGAVRWRSADADVFVVDGNGSVTARGNGVAYVQASDLKSADQALVQVRQAAVALESFGEGQEAAPGLSLIERVGARVLDAGGAPVSGVAVRFEPGAGSGSTDPVVAWSDSLGLAPVVWTLGPEPGRQTLAVSIEGAARVEIAATALEPEEAVASFEVRSGEDQWAWSGRALAEPVVVLALDEGARPISGAAVRFAPDAGGRADPETAVSDTAGMVSAAWTLGTTSGLQTLVVSTGGDASVEITATARDPDEAVASVKLNSGEDQWALAGHVLPDPVSVRAADETGQPVWGATVRFEPDAGSGRTDPVTATTDSLGLASAVWTLGSELGAQRLTANAADSEVVFEATAVSDQGVCNRTPAVSAEISRQAEVAHCSEVTEQMLGGVGRLALEREGIRRLRDGDFAGLVGLEELYLHGNLLADLPPSIFSGLSRMRRLNLSHNQLARLPHDVFADLSNLQELVLYQNRLRELESETFSGLAALWKLRIDNNELTELPEDLFDGLSNLELLTMRGNKLTELPWSVFSSLSRLDDLVIAENRLTSLPRDLLLESRRLRRISLDGNRLTSLPSDLFSETLELQRLYLQWNDLTGLPLGIFDRLSNLIRLDLSGNALTELPWGVFDGTPKLAQLSLESNELTELPPGVFAGLSELEWATLDGNPGAPFPVRPEFARIDDGDPLAAGPATVIARVPAGAPFAFDVPVSVQRGTISKDFVSLLPGDTASAPFTVTGAGAGVAAHVGFGPVPDVTAAGYAGLAVERGEELVLFAESDNRSPFARSPVPAHRMQAGGPSAELALGDHFGDPDGDRLTYEAATAVAGVVDVAVEDGVLRLDPLSVDTTEVEVTATDPEGLRVIQQFRAWVVPAPDPDAFNIELYFDPGFTPEEEAAIRRAADRWMEAVTGDLPDVPVHGVLQGNCIIGLSKLRVVGVIDDLLVEVKYAARLGTNVATVTNCGVREESGHTFFGRSSFALWYFRHPDQVVEKLYNIALHEVGHLLGIGSWIYRSRPQAWKELFQAGDTDPHFAGPLAVAAFNAAGGGGYSGGKVPLEDKIPTRGVHWRHRVIPDDVMAPYGKSLLTAITLQALADLGHEVDLSKADPYTLPGQAQGDTQAGAADAEEAVSELFADDVIHGPVVVVDRDGKVVRVIRP